MLKRCPTCNASVLDDDAVTCPFCGSPMDPKLAKGFRPANAGTATPAGKGSPPAQTARTNPTAAPGKGTAASAATKKNPSPSAPVEEDPFAISDATKNALPLSPKRTVSRPHAVTCPMCEAIGYAPATAGGREVRCANAKCLVPVFTAPVLVVAKEPEPVPKPSLLANPTLWTFLAVGLILAGAGAGWHFFLRREPPAAPPQTDPIARPTTPEPDPAAPRQVEEPPPVPAVDPATLVAARLDRLPTVAQDITQVQRKPWRRRLAAQAYAISGRPEQVREQLGHLRGLSDTIPFYAVPPLVELAWRQAGSDTTAAAATFAETKPLREGIPRRGFDPARVLIDWSAAAARFESIPAGRAALRTGDEDRANDPLLADLRAAALFHQFDLDAEANNRPLRDRSEPKSAAVVLELLRRGADDTARGWATSAETPAVRADDLAAWAEGRLFALPAENAPAAGVADIERLIPNEPADVRAWVWGRVASRAAGNPANQQFASGLFTRAKTAVLALPEPAPVGQMTLAELADWNPPDRDILLLRAGAAAETARAAYRLGQPQEGHALLDRALNLLRSIAPSPAAVAERSRELETLGIAGVQRQLQTAKGITREDEARQVAIEYRRRLRDAEAAAADRFDLQARWLAEAIRWGAADWVAEQIASRTTDADPGRREAYQSGRAGGRLLAAFESAANSAPPASAAQVTAAVAALKQAGVTAVDPLSQLEAAATKPGITPTNAAAAVSAPLRDVSDIDRMALALRLASRRANEQGPADAITFAKALKEEVTREETLRLVSAQSAARGQVAQVDAAAATLKLIPTEQAAITLGLVEGRAGKSP